MIREKCLFLLLLVLGFCSMPGVAGLKAEVAEKNYASRPKTVKKQDEKVVFQWHKQNLERHFLKHRAEFPEYKTAEEYGKAAVGFFSDPPKGTQFKRRSNGDRLLYYEKKNFFGAATKHGFIKTFFRPNRGKNYWKRQ